MIKKQIITIAGRLGSGKSSTAKMLANQLEYEHFSSGDLFREIALEQGNDVLAANKSAELDAKIDHLVDGKLREIGETQNKKVVDSRTAWHWMPDSYKVYLMLDSTVAAKRIIAKMHERASANESIPSSVEEYAEQLNERMQSENKRYKNLYSIDPSVLENYDLVIDTAVHSLEEVVEIIQTSYKEWLTS